MVNRKIGPPYWKTERAEVGSVMANGREAGMCAHVRCMVTCVAQTMLRVNCVRPWPLLHSPPPPPPLPLACPACRPRVGESLAVWLLLCHGSHDVRQGPAGDLSPLQVHPQERITSRMWVRTFISHKSTPSVAIQRKHLFNFVSFVEKQPFEI